MERSKVMVQRVNKFGYEVDKALLDFINTDVLSGLDIEEEAFWNNFASFINKFSAKNSALLNKRLELKKKIDDWHLSNKSKDININEYKDFLSGIGYLVPEGESFGIETKGVDDEISNICGPQLVVPITNARYALNAANARWGSLYDALYGTDVISEDNGAKREGGYNPIRGDKVIAFAKNFLDETIPLEGGSYKDVLGFEFKDGNINAILAEGNRTQLKEPDKYVGYTDNGDNSYGLLFINNNLHFEIQVDNSHPIGTTDRAGIKDILMESAITTIQDCEDSVAAVDGEDKTTVYRNWLGLMKGDLKESFNKNGSQMTRELSADRNYISKEGKNLVLPGRSLMLVRNVGHLMTNPGILDAEGSEVPEGIMDAMFKNMKRSKEQ